MGLIVAVVGDHPGISIVNIKTLLTKICSIQHVRGEAVSVVHALHEEGASFNLQLKGSHRM